MGSGLVCGKLVSRWVCLHLFSFSINGGLTSFGDIVARFRCGDELGLKLPRVTFTICRSPQSRQDPDKIVVMTTLALTQSGQAVSSPHQYQTSRFQRSR